MGGLARICKLYGGMEFVDKDGNKTIYTYDYANDKPRIKSEMTKEEIMASEKAKWIKLKEQLKQKL